ncbi:hypothetical protein QUB75_27035 [Microcoleus sp. K1-B6]|uniref:hypothetical protein n=1 Tax=unclassified Microcoleus TaxID=2642155 RepID=UPI002FD3B0C3
MNLSQAYLPQSWYKGEGLEELAQAVGGFWNNIVSAAGDLINRFANFVQQQLNKVNIFGVNFGQWLQEEPLQAIAGAGAALLTGGVVLIVGGAVAGFVGGGIVKIWKASRLAFSALGLGGLVRAAVGAVQRTWNFNFQISDKQIRAQQKSLLESQAGVWGEALGSLAGTLCGYSLGRVAYANQAELIRFNPDLIAKLDELRINNFDENSELWEESVQNLKTAIASSARAAMNIAGFEAYVNVRKAVKAIARGVNLSGMWPSLGKMVETWGDEGQKPWSFASAQEEWVESLPDGGIQNFVEEFLEAAQDMCAESSIQVSYAL